MERPTLLLTLGLCLVFALALLSASASKRAEKTQNSALNLTQSTGKAASAAR